MKTRLVAATVAVFAAILYLGAARPLTARALAKGDEYRSLREERRLRRATLSELERRDALVRRTVAALGSAAPASHAALRQVRRQVVQAVDAAELAGVRLSVRPTRAGGGAAVRVSGGGRVDRVLGLAGWLADPGRGTVLAEVRMSRGAPGEATLDVDALGFPTAAR